MIRVLYVDDEQPLLDLAKEFLAPEQDMTLTTTNKPEEGLRLALEGTYDVIVSDYLMPGMDGLAFLREIRSQGHDIPFILFTGKGREEVVIQALNEGADYYLQKGGQPRPQFVELIHKIRKAAEQREVRKALADREARLRRAEEIAEIGHWEIHLDTMTMIGSPGAARVYGAEGDHFPLKLAQSIPLPEYRNELDQALTDLIHNGKPYDIVFRIRRRNDGELRYIHSRAEYDPTRRVVFGVIHDINNEKLTELDLTKKNQDLNFTNEQLAATEEELRQTVNELVAQEKRLAESESKYRAALESAGVGFGYIDLKGTLLMLNTWGAKNLGGPPEQFIGRSLTDLFGNEAGKEYQERIRRAAKSNDVLEFEDSVPLLGETKWFISVYNRLLNTSGEVIGVQVFSHDITDRKRIEEELKRSEKELWQIIDNSPVAMTMSEGPEPTHFMINRKFTEIFGYSKNDVKDLDLWMQMVYPDPEYRRIVSTEWNKRLLASLKDQKEMDPVEVSITSKNGARHHVEVRMMPLRQRILIAFVDLTERKKNQEALQVANRKLNLLGSISRHDTLNRVTALKGFAEMLGMTALSNDQREMLRKINLTADAIANISKFTKQYQEIGMHEAVWQDVHHYLEVAQQSLHSDFIKIEEKGTRVKILADPMFEKVVHNLIDNAIRHGQKVTRVVVSFQVRNGKGMLVFEDDGVGITAVEREKLFQPGLGKNTGFGLFLSREILDITGIKIEETSDPGHGARFEITVPDGYYKMI